MKWNRTWGDRTRDSTALDRLDNARASASEVVRISIRISLQVQWLGIRLPMQGTRVRSLVWEDATCFGATEPMSHNYWSLRALEPLCCNKWSHRSEKLGHHHKEARSTQPEKALPIAMMIEHNQKKRSIKWVFLSHSIGSISYYEVNWSEVAQLCPTLCDPMDCSLSGSSLHGILQARVLEWVAISFSRGSSWPRDRTRVSHIPGRCFNLWATKEAHSYYGPWPKHWKPLS